MLNPVSSAERNRRNAHTGAVVWLTGLSGAGKSTLAVALDRAMFDRGWQSFVLDGDVVRSGLCADLGYGPEARAENLRRAAYVADLLARSGAIAIAAFISPYRRDRRAARQIIESAGNPFVEVHVSTPVHVCEARDPKGLYARARAGEIAEFTGVSAPFEIPEAADLAIDTSLVTISDAVQELLAHLTPRVSLGAEL